MDGARAMRGLCGLLMAKGIVKWHELVHLDEVMAETDTPAHVSSADVADKLQAKGVGAPQPVKAGDLFQVNGETWQAMEGTAKPHPDDTVCPICMRKTLQPAGNPAIAGACRSCGADLSDVNVEVLRAARRRAAPEEDD